MRSVSMGSRVGLRRTWGQRFLIVFNVIVVATALFSALTLRAGQTRTEALERVTLPGSVRPVSEHSEPGSRELNFLLVGSDSSSGLDPDDPIQIGRQGEQASDVIIVARFDEANAGLTLLSIPRDLWVPISGSSSENRINSAFAIGGPARLIDTINENMGIEIDYYVNVDFAGFQDLVEIVEGVEVYFPAPARDWDSAYNRSRTGFEVMEAGCHFLDPPTALAYVRSRHYQTMGPDGEWVDDSRGDLSRIERQQDFLRQLVAKAISDGARNPFVLASLVDETLDAVTVDDRLNAQLLLDLSGSYRSFEASDINSFSYPSYFTHVGSKSVLFSLDDDAEPLLELIRGASLSSPSTVRLVVIAHPGELELVEGMMDNLSDAGFALGEIELDSSAVGVSLNYGPAGWQAAELVRESLSSAGRADSPVLLLDPELPGRTIELRVGPEPEQAQPQPLDGEEESGGTDKSDANEADPGGAPIEAVPTQSAACG